MLKGSFSCSQKLQSKIEPFLFLARSNFPVNRPCDLGHWKAVRWRTGLHSSRSEEPSRRPGGGTEPRRQAGSPAANVLDTQSPVL